MKEELAAKIKYLEEQLQNAEHNFMQVMQVVALARKSEQWEPIDNLFEVFGLKIQEEESTDDKDKQPDEDKS